MTGQHPPRIGAVRPVNWAYDRAPMIMYWELTNACGLACKHCRATAQLEPMTGELSTDECIKVMDDMQAFGEPLPHIVMTGGDPLRRPDIWVLIDAAIERGIGVSLAPAVDALLTRECLAKMVEHGVQAISLSLDASTAEVHDGIRGIPGTFDRTLQALDDAAAVGMPVQINTLITCDTPPDIEPMYELLKQHTVMQWSLFFLISVGRGTQLVELSPGDAERTLIDVRKLTKGSPFRVKTTEAMQYRRIAAKELMRAGMTRDEIENGPYSRGFGIRDGNGIMFLSNLGEVTPSGFLPVSVGNVRQRSIVELYRDTPLMKSLRNPDEFKGRCGVCDFHDYCGGSRARAYTWTGDPLETDPLCPYVPPAWAEMEKAAKAEQASA